ncbi:MAG TPA: hypothetical protein VGL59_11150 [Polyangia bacterium]
MGIVASLFAIGVCGCSSSSIHSVDAGTGSGGSNGRDANGSGGTNGSGSGGSSATGGGGSSTTGSGGASGTGGQAASNGGTTGFVACTPGVQQSAVADCGYPVKSSSALTSIVFSESEVLRAIQPSGAAPEGIVRVFYNDEHALTLGVRRVVVKTAAGTTMTDYPVSPLATDPGSVMSPQVGTSDLAGDNSGLDQSLRPMWPVLFITDITADANNRAGDWQQGGVPRGPDAVFGSWKAAVRTVDKTTTPNKITVTPDPDPAKNKWDLATGDPAPAGLTDQGFGAEARWTVPLASGHNYRIQVIVHDGDQNKSGGDSGEGCVVFCAGGATPDGGAPGPDGGPPPIMCPAGVMACGQGGIDPVSCPDGTVCANGCCLTLIP